MILFCLCNILVIPVVITAGSGQLELAMRCGKVRRLHPIALNDDGKCMEGGGSEREIERE